MVIRLATNNLLLLRLKVSYSTKTLHWPQTNPDRASVRKLMQRTIKSVMFSILLLPHINGHGFLLQWEIKVSQG